MNRKLLNIITNLLSLNRQTEYIYSAQKEGHGLTQKEKNYKITTVEQENYLETKSGRLLYFTKQHVQKNGNPFLYITGSDKIQNKKTTLIL